MSRREKIARFIAAVIVLLLTTGLLYMGHVKRQSTKEQFMAAQSRRYDTFFQKPSIVRDFVASLFEVGTTLIIYEGLARTLMKIVPDNSRDS